jgi:hypothetical protein
MSVLSVTTISSNAATDDLTIQTSNTNGPQIVLYANGYGVLLKGNSTSNNVLVNNSLNYLTGSSDIGNFTSNGQVLLTGVVTPTVISSNTSAWNPGTSNVSVIRLQANSSVTSEILLSGLTAGTNGQVLILSNIGTKRIVVRNEDSANESTAANRFNLTNHTILDGYQSMKIIYDGTLARWRRLSSISDASQYGITGFGSGPLFSGFDYKSLLTIGFFGGGTTDGGTTKVSTVNKITYSTETRQATFANTLSSSRDGLAGAGNVDKGFLCGGGTPTFVNTADKVTYTTEAIGVVAGAALSQARAALGAAGNADKGFFAGGLNPTVLATAGRTTYSTETHAAVTGANLSQARYYPAGAGNADKGFFAGGLTPTLVATTDRTIYSTETTAAVSGANLSAARRNMAGVGNSDKGFFSGGFNPAVVATTDRTTYSSETTAAVSGANLSQARSTPAGAGTADKGFIAGGSTSQTSPYSPVTTAGRTTYSSETHAAVTGANLSQARDSLAAV